MTQLKLSRDKPYFHNNINNIPNLQNNIQDRICIDRLFPDVAEKNLFYKLKIDRESIMYISNPDTAKKITNIIISHIKKFHNYTTDLYITDATAGVGGDTISFANNFTHVNSIEKNKIRYNYLLNNVCAYKFENVSLYCGDMLDVIPKISHQDVIFIDPPWGGKTYKRKNLLRLEINDIELETICLDLFNPIKVSCPPKFIVLKLPLNYDLKYIYSSVGFVADIKIYTLMKMIIVVLSKKI